MEEKKASTPDICMLFIFTVLPVCLAAESIAIAAYHSDRLSSEGG